MLGGIVFASEIIPKNSVPERSTTPSSAPCEPQRCSTEQYFRREKTGGVGVSNLEGRTSRKLMVGTHMARLREEQPFEDLAFHDLH